MKYLLLVLCFSINAQAGEWKRISADTISFSGEVTKEDVARFQSIYRPTDKTVLLNSSGGMIEPALKIAQILIKNKNLETVAKGLCASSCANYLFLAGKTRRIDGGVVGYHGSARAYLQSEKILLEMKKVDPKIVAERLPVLKKLAADEDAFFAQANVPSELFKRTQRENDLGLYEIYVPGPNAFRKYGIKSVVGKQDLSLMKSLIKDNQIQILYEDSFASEMAKTKSFGIR